MTMGQRVWIGSERQVKVYWRRDCQGLSSGSSLAHGAEVGLEPGD